MIHIVDNVDNSEERWYPIAWMLMPRKVEIAYQ